MKLYVQQIPGVSAVSSVSLNGESDLLIDLNDTRIVLEGHNLKGNDSNYVRTTEKRLQQEYEKAIDNLTINEDNRLKRKVEILQVEKSKIEDIRKELDLLKRKVK